MKELFCGLLVIVLIGLFWRGISVCLSDQCQTIKLEIKQ